MKKWNMRNKDIPWICLYVEGNQDNSNSLINLLKLWIIKSSNKNITGLLQDKINYKNKFPNILFSINDNFKILYTETVANTHHSLVLKFVNKKLFSRNIQLQSQNESSHFLCDWGDKGQLFLTKSQFFVTSGKSSQWMV